MGASYKWYRTLIFPLIAQAAVAVDLGGENFVTLWIMDGIYRSMGCRGTAVLLFLSSVGCQVVAPIHVWARPRLQSAVGHKVAVAPISGDQKIAGPLHIAMIAQAPQEIGRTIQCIDARSLQNNQTIRLVSAVEGETSDIANLSLARRQGIDFLLTGELIRQSEASRTTMKGKSLAVSWKLVDVRGHSTAAGIPIITQHDDTLDSQAIAMAAAEDAWKLITPHVQSTSVHLAKTFLEAGSSGVNKGNASAVQGDWMMAEDNWNRVLLAHPKQHAAMHNLAIAAVARQDYDEARRMIARTLHRRNKPLYRQTAVWIEARQRDYHEAFGLSDPITGWAATRR